MFSPRRRPAYRRQPQRSRCRVDLLVRQADGTPRHFTRGCENDLALDNYVEIQEHYWEAEESTDSIANITDQTGSPRSLYVRRPNTLTAAFTAPNPQAQLDIVLGDGNGSPVTPDRGNHQLDRLRFENRASEADLGGNIITFSAVMFNTLGFDITVREAGIRMTGRDTSSTPRDVLLFHEATGATLVEDTESVTATYTISWP